MDNEERIKTNKEMQEINNIKPILKVSHREISVDFLSNSFKRGIRDTSVIENPLWEGAYLIHSYLDTDKRILHLFYHDPVKGTIVQEGQDLCSVEPICTVFMEEKQ